MALTDLNTTINHCRDKAAEVRAEHAHRVETIQNDPHLSSIGKTGKIAQSYRTTSETIAKLATEESTALAAKRLELERELFGQFATDPMSIIAYRDAQERVAQLTMEDQRAAGELLHAAQISGDTHLAAAILRKALDSGWERIAQTYTAANPDKSEQLKDLADVVHFSNDINVEFQRTAAYSFSKPREIAQYVDSTIDRIADAAGETPESTQPMSMRDLEQWAAANG